MNRPAITSVSTLSYNDVNIDTVGINITDAETKRIKVNTFSVDQIGMEVNMNNDANDCPHGYDEEVVKAALAAKNGDLSIDGVYGHVIAHMEGCPSCMCLFLETKNG